MTQQEFQTRYKYNPSTDCIGEGGFGKVYKAYDTHLDKWVAIKVAEVKPGLEQVRLKKEVEMVSKLPTHTNIANYEACYTFSSFTGEYDFAVLQYYEEGNLQQLMDSAKLNQTQKESLLRHILEGVGFLHNQDIIHRDLKPQNILIANRNDEYIPKITDFGISKKLDFNKSSVFTNSLAGAGTMAYASPEQLLGKTIKKNTDLWSFGVIAFQLMIGKLPFNTGNETVTSEAGRLELFKQITSGLVTTQLGIIPAEWHNLIMKCLVVDAKNRLSDANSCLTLLNGNTSLSTEKQLHETENINTTRISTPYTNTSNNTILDDSTRVETQLTNLLNTSLFEESTSLKSIFKSKRNKIIKVFSLIIVVFLVSVLYIYFKPNFEKNTIRDIDGNIYHTVTIGTQTWLVENLKTKRLNDGTRIANIENDKTWSNTTSPAYCYYMNEKKSGNKYGILYNFHAVKTGKLAPRGWRVANDVDWELLAKYTNTTDGNTGYLKESDSYWGETNEEAINKFGFSALPIGNRGCSVDNYLGLGKIDGKFYNRINFTRWWSSTVLDNTHASSYGIQNKLYATFNLYNDGLGVRCIKEN